ncbi:hypothetical protein M9H77_25381 [Catharanthus roseus]|uniref:Uncharacterized protein n=1 Tax=Catharanthus roseus TaxID=4058 RepID=A0ACC0AAX2_CATRO|nr:hypothetical protein M9H77_25381 [Catharanthus roseus]
MNELKKARQMVEEPGSNCLHYLRKSYGLPCACELVNRCQHLMPIREEDVDIFWRKLEIGSDIPEEHHREMESEMRDLISLLQEISTDPISNVRELRRLIKGVIHPVLPDDPCQSFLTPPKTVVTKGRRKTNSTKRDKSHWKYVSIAHKKIGKFSGSGYGSGSGSGSGSNPNPRGRGRPPRSGRSRGRGRSSDEAVTRRPSTRPVLSVTGPKSASLLRPLDLPPLSLYELPPILQALQFTGREKEMEKTSEMKNTPGSRQLNLKKSFKLGIRSLLTACSKEDEFESLCLETQVCFYHGIVVLSFALNLLEGTILDSVEQHVEEQSLDPLLNEKYVLGVIQCNSDEHTVGTWIGFWMGVLGYLVFAAAFATETAAEEQKRLLSDRLDLKRKQRQDFSVAQAVVGKGKRCDW